MVGTPMTDNKIRTYSELITLPTYEERLRYLKLDGIVGYDTFGFDRYVNQQFYKSKEWKNMRSYIITRDCCCDLACPDREIFDKVYVHHMNPIQLSDIEDSTDFLLNPEYLICVSLDTHNYIHYGDSTKRVAYTERKQGDTRLW